MAKQNIITPLDNLESIKLPSAFRRAIEVTSDGEIFVVSTDDSQDYQLQKDGI